RESSRVRMPFTAKLIDDKRNPNMKHKTQPSATQMRAAVRLAKKELKIAAQILEWEIGDIWGHVGVRLPQDEGIAVQMFRRPESGGPIYPKPVYTLDDAEGADLARTLGQAVAVMIKGHGIATVGKTIDEACMCALRMERAAKIMAIAQLFGFKGVSDEFIEQLSESKEKLFSRQRNTMTHSADWNY